jgi:hypothetical protein
MERLFHELQPAMNQRGAVAILVAVALVVLVGFTALAIDVGHLVVARNELQNAADAGALAGARFLYNEYGTAVNGDANKIAYNAATANMSENLAVEVDCDFGSNSGDVQRGHWCFATRTFTPNASLKPVDLWNASTEELDADPYFINAVRVVTKRQSSPVISFFARIFGHQGFQVFTDAVGYIGFAGTLAPGEVDAPIAICSQSLNGNTAADECESGYDCNIGYMLSDGQDKNTAAWTNFTQPCSTADTESLRDLLTCTAANPDEIELGGSVGATNGVVDAVINHPTQNNLMHCWKTALYDSNDDGEIDENDSPIDTDGDGWPDMPWNLTLPTVNCPNLQVSNCMETCGAVNVNIVWILEKENDVDGDAPYKMDKWVEMEDEPDGITRWDSFVTHFKLMTPDGLLATYENGGFKKKSIYFLPDCTPHELKGNTGGHNYGVLARIPVLVE